MKNSVDHVAIMKKSWGLTRKILSGEKNVETRWYKNRSLPWGKIKKGDRIYFKDSGEPVALTATVEKILQVENLNCQKVRKYLTKYGRRDGIGKKWDNFIKYFELFKEKRYLIVIFFKDVQRVKPFEINKKGYGAMAAWITVGDIRKIRKRR